jgi:MinD-like ATPase involved in chromosome partitioning or flagellar assembly
MKDKDKEATIVTFYSYKGGVGRSMALANVAWLLAEGSNRKVLVVDWDLEAPGLHRFFGMKDEDISKGLIEVLNDYKALLRKETGSLPEKLVDLHKYVQPIRPFSNGGRISILAAGGQQDTRAYAAAINAFSWEDFYANWRGFGFIEHLKEQLRTFEETDIVLVDSRTGVTDIGGICTLQLPDVVVILFAMNDQNILGAKSVAERISKKAGELEGRAAPPILILRPARIERSSGNQDKKLEWQAKAASQLGEYFTDPDPEAVIAKKNIPYVSDFSYGETPLAVVKDPLGDITDSFKDLASSIIRAAERGGQDSEQPRRSASEQLMRYLRSNLILFFVKRQNVYLLGAMLAFIALGFSLARVRSLTGTSQTLQQQIDLKDQEIAGLKRQLPTPIASPVPSPTPIPMNKSVITIQLADESQREAANRLFTILLHEGFGVSTKIDVVNASQVPPQMLVKYFHPEDQNQAETILGVVRKTIGSGSADSNIDLNEPLDDEDPGFFEIWFPRGPLK